MLEQLKKFVRRVRSGWQATRLKPAAFQELAQAASPAIPPARPLPLFNNPFSLADLAVFDNKTLRELFRRDSFGVSLKELALALHGTDQTLSRKIARQMPYARRLRFRRELNRPAALPKIEAARRKLLDGLFWELTYWKTPELYEEFTAGETLHPGIFKELAPAIRGKRVLDAGAGSGRASLESLRYGAALVYAVEPSPGLLKILENKLKNQPAQHRIKPLQGRFDHLPLADNQVDLTVSCSAFTADPAQGGEPGLKEFIRVTRNGGKIVLIWPRPEDYDWLAQHGFSYVSLPGRSRMKVAFSSMKAAWEVARRFYARNEKLQ
jgi:SAM-dependent methyltransferase